MNPNRLALLVALPVAFLAAFPRPASAVPISGPNDVVAETFETLTVTVTHKPFEQGSTLDGWYAFPHNAAANGAQVEMRGNPDGSVISPGLFYRFFDATGGTEGNSVGFSPDAAAPALLALRLENATAKDLTELHVAYAARVWAQPRINSDGVLSVSYAVNVEPPNDIVALAAWMADEANWTECPELAFPANDVTTDFVPVRAKLSGFSWKKGAQCWIRWVFRPVSAGGASTSIARVKVSPAPLAD
jgi:hypothetical protein